MSEVTLLMRELTSPSMVLTSEEKSPPFVLLVLKRSVWPMREVFSWRVPY
jgi:hypothetical protein